MADAKIIDMNAARKRLRGLADTGMCPMCGLPRYTCRVLGECEEAVAVSQGPGTVLGWKGT